jgi:Mg-chelatase subunit ChlD
MLRPWRFPCAALLAAGVMFHLCAAPAPLRDRPQVEVVFCIDTTGSMDGLVEAAKARFWAIANRITAGRPTPELRIGLINFKDRGDTFITAVYPLTDDLDSVYNSLLTFRAEGGGDTPESVNQALEDSINRIRWSANPGTLRLVFLVGDAPPHMDYPDDVKYPVTCKQARQRGIVINAIQCGTDPDCTRHFKNIARLGGGEFAAIGQAGGITATTTPYDQPLAEINQALARTVLVHGLASRQEADLKKLRTAGNLPSVEAADRIGYLVRDGRAAAFDLLDAVRAGQQSLDELKTGEWPAELRQRTARERSDHLDSLCRQRARLFEEARGLDRQRSAFLAAGPARSTDTFDGQVLAILGKQVKRRIRY